MNPNPPIPGTIVIYGPFFARTGFGLLARGWAMAFHNAGAKVRIVPVDCNDPNASGDLDDCDLYLLQSLKYTPLTTPVTAIFAYVPTYVWPKTPLPEPNRRIMLTTFDSSANAAAPPSRLIFICNQMDQVWVANRTEEQAWIRGGLNPEKVHSFNWPHEWIDNPQLGPPLMKGALPGVPFRFLHISLFLPRRRLDVLIRAFFEEFQEATRAELYLKMSYPSWHPVPGKPKKDLQELIERLRQQTGSHAKVIVDETLGTRLELARLIDSCDAYISPDTTHTAPVTEAIVRNRPVIITDGWGVDLPPQARVVPNSADRVTITPEMAEYMPHQRGASYPALDVGLMRQALQRTFALSADERRSLVESAALYMRERYSYAATAPAAIAAIRKAWDDRQSHVTASEMPAARSPQTTSPFNLHWCGLQLFYGKIPTANREICLELLRRGHRVSLVPGNGPFHIEEFDLDASPKCRELARRFYEPLAAPADFNVSFRWHPFFNERPAARQVFANTWWSGAIPVDWVKPLAEYAGEVWVPSRFVRDNFERGGVPAGQLQTIPLGIDPAIYCPGITPHPLQTRKRFKFLFVGETTPRKGLDVLLKTYLRTFSRKDDVCLVIKDMDCEDYYARNAALKMIQQCQGNPSCPEIEYLTAMLPEESLAGLYAACDCFVQPHRAASFGLAALEAMACGLPVITTAYGGVLDFCDNDSPLLLPAREVRHKLTFVGHWKVTGEQLHAEIDERELQERMDQVFRDPAGPAQRARRASERVRTEFTWAKTVDRILERFQALQLKEPSWASRPARGRARSAGPTRHAPKPGVDTKAGGPTALIVAPLYNRSGYGVAARALATALHDTGMAIRTVPVDNVELGIDDCDLNWLKSLEKTPVTLPVVAIFFHVPNPVWLTVPLPPQSIRILFTTFDSSAQGNLPPPEWIAVCKQMDQLWLMTEKEASIFAAAGVPPSKIHVVKCPHPWINNPLLSLPPAAGESETGRARPPRRAASAPGTQLPQRAAEGAPCPPSEGHRNKFRFLSIAMFLPRRRWDALIEAYLAEFKDTPDVQLLLKVNYPSWHPVPGQPPKDLRQLIQTLRAKTGSPAGIILDESLDTRLGICRLIDSCDAYVSTDTSITAPVGEAFVRGKIAVIPDGFGAALPYCEGALVIPVDPKLSQPMTDAMLQYQPHHRGKQMPLLRVEDVRRTLRAAFELPAAERRQMGHLASLVMECAYGAPVVNPAFLRAMNAGLREKFGGGVKGEPPTARTISPEPAAAGVKCHVNWEGSFVDLGSLSYVNRELTRILAGRPDFELCRVGSSLLSGPAAQCPELQELSRALKPAPAADAQVTVRHAWPPNWKAPSRGALVVIQPWEFGALPEEWVRQSNHVTEFWVPSEYVRRCYTESGIPAAKVQVVPNGIDPARFRPDAPAKHLATRKTFKFLFVGGTIGRKGADVLLETFLRTFTASDDVCLVIKDFGGQSVYTGQTLEARIKTAIAQPDAPEILYLNDELPPESLPGLYTACDCLVHPYRGEGFGLPILEAMACGLPAIVTAGGAADDFAGENHAYRISARRISIGDTVSGLKLAGPGWLLEPNAQALAERMKWIVANRAEARAKGACASEYARRQWTWERAADVIQQRLKTLATEHKMAANGTGPQLRKKRRSVATPPCARLGNLDVAKALLGRRSLSEAWEETTAAIRLRPYHPEGYLLLAEIALAAGDAAAARQCAQRARDLAPGWNAPKHFLQKPLKGNTHLVWLKLPFANASNPASSIQHPASRLTVCVIAKNEEQFIAQCLTSVKAIAHQIVLVDTGSSDRTVEIAKSLGAEVHAFAWGDDFSAARNAALEQATGDWILMLDADEELPADQHARLKTDLENKKMIACRLPLVNRGQETEGRSHVPRLFRNAPGAFYEGRIHEQVFPSLITLSKGWGLNTGLGTAQLLHHGYAKDIVKDRNKIDRNLNLLRQAIDENPGDANLVMNLGLELIRSGDLNTGLTHYREAFRLMSAEPAAEIVPELREALLTQLTCHLYKVRAHDEVVKTLTSPLAKQGGLTASLHFALGLAQFELKQYREAAEQLRQCLAKRAQTALSPINTDILTAAPHHCLALCLAKAGDVTGAEKAFQSALREKGRLEAVKPDYARFLAEQNRPVEAFQQLHETVSQDPHNAAAWRLGGEIALSRREFLEFACDWTGEAVRHLPEDPVLIDQRAEVLLLVGQLAGARQLWEKACNGTRPPRALAAVILCAAAGSEAVPPTTGAAEETATSRAFLEWYQRLVSAGANDTIVRLNSRVDSFRDSLPTAARLLDSALAEAKNQPA
jgi:glycosyltransferase involved in cell wall biosynthesis/tetratricopeptide (TPR) repeat protein